MATVKKIKKAQPGCKWSKGEKPYRRPIGESIGNLLWDMKLKRDERKQAREERRNPSKGNDEGFERDFPEGGAAPGLWGETKGSKDTRWKSTEYRKGGKVVKKAAVKKAAVKKAVVKKSVVKKQSKKK